VSGEQALGCPAGDGGGELPVEVEGVTDAQVQSLAAGRGMNVRSVAGQQDPARAVGNGLPGSADEVFGLVATVQTFVHGSVMRQLAEQEAGLQLGSWMAAQGSYGDSIISGGAYPALIRIMVEAKTPHLADLHDRIFFEGLEHVLDGYRPGG
jgi:Tetracyclin repressor-like, C-terminal domain